MLKIKTLNEIAKRKEEYILSRLGKTEKDVLNLQDKLLTMILKEYFPKFKLDAQGNIINNLKNIRLLYEIDEIFDKFQNTYEVAVLNTISKDMLKISVFNEKYYKYFDVEEKTMKGVIEKSKRVYDAIGINQDGSIMKNGYMDSVTYKSEMRAEFKKLVIDAINSKVSYHKFIADMSEKIETTSKKTGILERYYRQYIYDLYNKIDNAQNLFIADELELQAFVYSGSKIRTTRDFCADKIGKVWTRKEAEGWNKEDWAGKIPNCDVLVCAGGYNCRHGFRWITNSLAKMQRPELKEVLK